MRKNYRPVKYHNWRHAVTVAQTMFAMLKTGKMERFMSELEVREGKGREGKGKEGKGKEGKGRYLMTTNHLQGLITRGRLQKCSLVTQTMKRG